MSADLCLVLLLDAVAPWRADGAEPPASARSQIEVFNLAREMLTRRGTRQRRNLVQCRFALPEAA